MIELILVLQQQMAAQQELIQKLQDQLAKDSHNSGKSTKFSRRKRCFQARDRGLTLDGSTAPA